MLKGFAAATTGSAAMLAETFHSIADTGNQPRAILVVLGVVFRRDLSVAGIESAVARLHQRVRDALAGRTDALREVRKAARSPSPWRPSWP